MPLRRLHDDATMMRRRDWRFDNFVFDRFASLSIASIEWTRSSMALWSAKQALSLLQHRKHVTTGMNERSDAGLPQFCFMFARSTRQIDVRCARISEGHGGVDPCARIGGVVATEANEFRSRCFE